MTTYYIRSRITGEIVNAVETASFDGALKACAGCIDDVYPDPDPPMAVLSRYRYWSERP